MTSATILAIGFLLILASFSFSDEDFVEHVFNCDHISGFTLRLGCFGAGACLIYGIITESFWIKMIALVTIFCGLALNSNAVKFAKVEVDSDKLGATGMILLITFLILINRVTAF